MASFYVHLGHVWDMPRFLTRDDDSWTVSIGSVEQPRVVHFKSKKDMIAYCQGHHPTLNDPYWKQRYEEITGGLDKDVRTVVFPVWQGRWKHLLFRLFGRI